MRRRNDTKWTLLFFRRTSSLHPCPRSSVLHHSSRLLVPLKPYYNPANLWDGGQRVKKKEFIVSISAARSRASPSHQRSSETRWHFLVGASRVGIARPRCAPPNAKQVPPLFHRRRSRPAARDFSAPRARTESRRDRSRPQTPGRRFRSRGKRPLSRPALSPIAPKAKSFSRAGRPCNGSLRWIFECARTRPDARLSRNAHSHRAILSHQSAFVFRLLQEKLAPRAAIG